VTGARQTGVPATAWSWRVDVRSQIAANCTQAPKLDGVSNRVVVSMLSWPTRYVNVLQRPHTARTRVEGKRSETRDDDRVIGTGGAIGQLAPQHLRETSSD
jgi:hypothetical protein